MKKTAQSRLAELRKHLWLIPHLVDISIAGYKLLVAYDVVPPLF